MSYKISQRTSNKIVNMSILCAVLVVSIHIVRKVPVDSSAWWAFAAGSETISRMAVPFFFLCSGFFLASRYGEQGWYGAAIRKRLLSIGVPYLVFDAAFYLAPKFMAVVSNAIHRRQLLQNIVFGDDFLCVFGLVPWRLPCLGVLWYCRCLLILIGISPCLFWVLRGKWGSRSVALLYLVWLILMPWTGNPNGKMALFFIYTFSLEGLLFFSIGAFVRLHEIHWDANLAQKMIVLSCAVVFVLLRILTMRMECAYSHYFVRLSIPFCLMSAWWLIPDRKFSWFVAGTPFHIYLVHKFFFIQCGGILSRWALTGLLAYIGVLTMVVVCSVLTTAAFRRVSPMLARIVFGGR